ncbi:MAG: hypothetical protein IJC73_03730 [Lentisphaeria bacterium]|nr:hypothetical protein [Lentisphaeria bacterium]
MISKHPFTLLEIVLAMSIFAVLTMLTGAVVYALPRSCALQREQAVRQADLIRMERVMDMAFRNAVPFTWKDPHGVSKQIFRGDSTCVVFAFRSPLDDNGSGLRFAALGLTDGRIRIQYRNEPIVYFRKETLPHTLNEEVLMDNVSELELLYVDHRNGELTWLDDWPEDEKNDIPEAIGAIVTFTDGTQAKFLRRTAGNSCYTSYGRRP